MAFNILTRLRQKYNILPNKFRLDEQQRKDFGEAAKPLIKFLNENCHPHVTVFVDCNNAELVEGVVIFSTEEYSKD